MSDITVLVSAIANYYRIKDWLHVLWLPVLGFAYNSDFRIAPFFHALLLSSLLLAFAYSFDRQYDINRGKEKLKGRMQPSILSAVLALFYSLVLGSEPFLLSLFAVLIVVSYVLPPLRLKGRPLFVTLLNSLGFTAIFLIGYSTSSVITLDILLVSVFIAIVLFPVQLVHEIAHFNKDRKMGLRTTPIRYGFRKTRLFTLVSLLVLNAWSIFLYIYSNSILIPISSIAFSLAFHSTLKSVKDPSEIRMRIRYISAILGLTLFFAFLLRI